MAINQPLKNIIPLDTPPSFGQPTTALLRAIELGELKLRVSTMLGCDYIFVSHFMPHALLEPAKIHMTIRELLDMLDTSARQSLVISVEQLIEGDPIFTRYDYTWDNRRVTQVTPKQIRQVEQLDFITMMYDCSSSC